MFNANISYVNPTQFHQSNYPKIRVPANVSAKEPIYVSAAELVQKSDGSSLKIVGGLTVSDFTTSFESRQWQATDSGSGGPVWKFKGDEYTFYLSISIFVQEGFKPFPKMVALIMEHELQHVSDEIDLMNNFLVKEIQNDPLVKEVLINKKPIEEGKFDTYFRKNKFQDWIKDGIWAPEHNKRADARDSGAEWSRYRDKLDALQRA